MPPLFALLPLRRMVRIKGRLLRSPAILLGLLALFTLMFSGCGSEKRLIRPRPAGIGRYR